MGSRGAAGPTTGCPTRSPAIPWCGWISAVTAPARTPGAYRIGDYADDAVKVLREIGPAFVVGHSLGGVAAWRAAQRVPELVLGAVLEDPPLFLGSPQGHASNGAIPH